MCKRIIRNREVLFQEPPSKVIYCYGVWQKAFEDMEDEVEFREGLPSEDIGNGEEHILLIIDDLMDEVVADKRMEQLFVRGSHHKNITVLYINQNMFCQGRHARTINLNCHYMVLFESRDVLQIGKLGSQMGIGRKLVEAYRDSTSKPFGYLVIDNSPRNHTPYKLLTDIFPGQDLVAYL